MNISNPHHIGYIGLPLGQKQNFFEQFLAALDGKMTTPTLFGWYHLLCLIIMISLCVVIALKCRNVTDKQVDIVLGATAAALLFLEVYKQLNYSYDWESDLWSYQWYAFPFQFCSTPMYVMTAAALIKNEKVKSALHSFLATYGLFAGAAVMLYPGDVFTQTIGINIQTMIHHGAMVVIAVFLYVTGRAKTEQKTILRALPVFAVLLTSALVMNLLYGAFGDPEQTFNMFFISPYYDCTLPVLSSIYPLVPYPVFLALYTVGFTIAGYLMSLGAMLVEKLAKRQSQKGVTQTKTQP